MHYTEKFSLDEKLFNYSKPLIELSKYYKYFNERDTYLHTKTTD